MTSRELREPESRAITEAIRLARLRRVVRAIMALLALPVVLFLFFFIKLAITGDFERVPSDVYTSGDLEEIGAALRGATPQAQIPVISSLPPDDPFYVELDPATINSVPEPVDDLIQEAADRWVREINRTNPQAILYYEVDAYANLYLFPGAWLYEFEPNIIANSTESFGVMWQQYMLDALGDWNDPELETGDGDYSPGLIFVDCKGEVSRLMAGYVRVLRSPEICD